MDRPPLAVAQLAHAGPHCSGKTAVLGHTSNKQGQIVNLGHLVCIDTYCCGGYWLTAFDATTGRVWQANEAGEFRSGELPPIQAPRHQSVLATPPLGGEVSDGG